VKRYIVMLAAMALLMVALAVPAYAQASISLGGDAVITSSKVLSVPITATCDPVGQETTFIGVTVTQPRGGAGVSTSPRSRYESCRAQVSAATPRGGLSPSCQRVSCCPTTADFADTLCCGLHPSRPLA